MIDEAHAFGIFGNNLAGAFDGIKDIDIITATLGKSLGSQGAFCVSSRTVTDYLINKADSFIFSTALPSVNILWTYYLLEEKFQYIKAKAEKLKQIISDANKYINSNGKTQIITLIIGENEKTVKVAEHLQSKGYFVLPVRPPTVPEGSSRLRLSLTSDITFNEFKMLIDFAKEVM